jgi:hypothetical protein
MNEWKWKRYTTLEIKSNENGTSAVRDDFDARGGGGETYGGTELGDRGLALLLLPSLDLGLSGAFGRLGLPFEADCRARAFLLLLGLLEGPELSVEWIAVSCDDTVHRA